MADYKVVHEELVPFERGNFCLKYYDKLSVDFIVHHNTKVAAWAKKIGRQYSVTPLRKDLTIPLISRNFLEG